MWTFVITTSLKDEEPKHRVVLQDTPLHLLVIRGIGEKLCDLTGHRFCMTWPISRMLGAGYDSKYDLAEVGIDHDALVKVDSIFADFHSDDEDEDEPEVTERGA